LGQIPEIINEHAAAVWLNVTPRLWAVLAGHRIFFGDKTIAKMGPLQFDKTASVEPYVNLFGSNFLHTIGVCSYTFSGLNRFGISVGRYCSIAGGVYCLGGNHPMNRVTTSNITFTGHQEQHVAMSADLFDGQPITRLLTGLSYTPPRIEHDVWIGDNAQLREGVTLGRGCVVGSCAVVSKDVPPYAVVVGNPAVIKKFRFPQTIINRLIASRWWDYHPRILHEFGTADVPGFLDRLDEAREAGSLEPFSPMALTWPSLRAELEVG
jgi:virginiamycin A acetyltransferase